MKYILSGIVLFSLFSCADNGNPKNTLLNTGDTSYYWTQVADSAAWPKSYNFQAITIQDTLRIFHPDGNWYSVDGKNWVKSPLSDMIHNQAFLDYIPFNNAVYGLGRLEGNIEQFVFKPCIYQTTDFKQWDTLSCNSNIPGRFFYHPFVFEHKLWIIGGEDKNTGYADIWNSTDGVQWVKQKDSLPFGKRSQSRVVYFKGKLFLLNNDVWSSADGLNWEKETDAIVKDETIFGYTAIVYDEKIWLLGCSRNGQFVSQVYYSTDGKTWKGLQAPWSPRGGVAAAVFRDKLYLTGGKYGGLIENGITTEFIYSNDIWVLAKK
jgi:hypothetical protein